MPKTIRVDVHQQHRSSVDPAFEIYMDATFSNAALLSRLRIGPQFETFSIDHLFHGLATRGFENSLKKDNANLQHPAVPSQHLKPHACKFASISSR